MFFVQPVSYCFTKWVSATLARGYSVSTNGKLPVNKCVPFDRKENGNPSIFSSWHYMKSLDFKIFRARFMGSIIFSPLYSSSSLFDLSFYKTIYKLCCTPTPPHLPSSILSPLCPLLSQESGVTSPQWSHSPDVRTSFKDLLL